MKRGLTNADAASAQSKRAQYLFVIFIKFLFSEFSLLWNFII